jgi:hypothetical protein
MTPLLLLAWRTASAGCPAALTSADLIAALDDAKAAYSNLDVTEFRAAMARVQVGLPCATDEITPHVAAELHRFEGLLGFLDRITERSLTAFAAARSIEPNYKFPESLVPVGNPVLADYEQLDPDSGQTMRVGEPVSGRILFDGSPIAQRPRNFPTVIQLIDDGGAVTTTAYLWPGEALPSYAAKEVTIAAVDPVSGRSIAGGMPTGPNRGLMIGAGTTAALAGLLYGGAFVVHKRYDDPETRIDSLDGLRTVNNSLVVASGASVALAIGLGTSAFVVARF